MKNILTILFILGAVACSGQNVMDYPVKADPENDDWIYLINGGTTDARSSKLQFQQSLLDSLYNHWLSIVANTLAIDINTDSIVSNEARIAINETGISNNDTDISDLNDSIPELRVDIDTNTNQIETNGTNISGNSVAIADIEDDVSALYDSIAAHRTLLDSAFGEIARLWDTVNGYHGVTPPDPVPDYVYADPDSVEVIHVINFDQYSASANPLIADIESGMPYGGYIGLADTGSYTTFAELVDYDGEGDIILQSKYLEGWGCFENATGCDSSGGGILWRENINPTYGERDTIYLTVVAYFEDNFALGDGLKMPGAYNTESGARDARSMRTMLKTTGDADDGKLTYLFYDYGFDNSTDPDNSAKPSLGAISGYGDYPDTIRMGEWVSITIQLYSGHSNSYDAMHATYLNDTCISYRSSLMVNNSVDGTAYFDIIDISTFPGGNDNSYTMPVTTNMYIKTVTMWREKYADMHSTPAYQRVIKLPEETEWDPDLISPEL